MISVKIHKSYRNVVALCDSNLIGKRFEEGIRQLDVRESFYNGEEMDESKILELIQFQAGEDSTFNLVGEESIAIAKKAGLISDEGVKKVQGIPFALVLL